MRAPNREPSPFDHPLECNVPGQGEPLRLWLMPERTAYWPAGRTLFAADLHLGKAATFRARGLPVPQGTTTETLDRLTRAVGRTAAERLVVLGDFLHARESHARPTLDALRQWRARHGDLACQVVRGNHDRHAGDVEASMGFEVLPGLYERGPLIGVHEMRDLPHAASERGDRLVLMGHVHPVVTLRSAFDRLRLPCFWLNGGILTLPAFGAFTGGHDIPPGEGQVFPVGERVMPLPPKAQALR